jgi:hypothetical protein
VAKGILASLNQLNFSFGEIEHGSIPGFLSQKKSAKLYQSKAGDNFGNRRYLLKDPNYKLTYHFIVLQLS